MDRLETISSVILMRVVACLTEVVLERGDRAESGCALENLPRDASITSVSG